MADKLNIPGFKHYELDSVYHAKLAAGEVDPKDLSFVKETGKIHTQGGVYGGGANFPIEILHIGRNLTDDQKAHNVNIYNKLRNCEKILVASLDLLSDGHYCIFSHITWLLNDSLNEVVGITLNQPTILDKAYDTEELFISKAEVNLYPDGSTGGDILEKTFSGSSDDMEAFVPLSRDFSDDFNNDFAI